jgi:cytochrome c
MKRVSISRWTLRSTGITLWIIVSLVACSREDPSIISRSATPTSQETQQTTVAEASGDIAHGEQVFNQGCQNCHTTTTEMKIGPGLAGLFEPGGPELPPGVDYGGNLPNGEPITEENVKAWIRTGGQGEIGAMPPNGGISNLTERDLDDLVAYLKTLEK